MKLKAETVSVMPTSNEGSLIQNLSVPNESHNQFSDDSIPPEPQRDRHPPDAKPLESNKRADVSPGESQVTSSFADVFVSERPPLFPRIMTNDTQDKFEFFSPKLLDMKSNKDKSKEQEGRLKAIKNRLQTVDCIVLSGDQVNDVVDGNDDDGDDNDNDDNDNDNDDAQNVSIGNFRGEVSITSRSEKTLNELTIKRASLGTLKY